MATMIAPFGSIPALIASLDKAF